ncbi:GGDEF domain-containing protein [Candidatus Parcubacteria bacterium]|jgi:diguanylate cyclase (GGDEF)-like protein|nr:GGDEF domain-containing protein [Candidatus Parcubacteria bacterium]MBT3948893.1 GGDEF domain-containing protein [Candidatus Parcubacteria bacterium]
MNETGKGREFTMAKVKESRARPDELVPMPEDSHFRQLIDEEGGEDDIEDIKSKYKEIAREVVSRIIFSILEENIEQKSAEQLGINKEQLKNIRTAFLKAESGDPENMDSDIEQILSTEAPEVSKDQFDNFINLVEIGTDPKTQEVMLGVIGQQIEQVTPYLLKRAKIEYDLERRQLLDPKTGALNQDGIEARFQAEAIKLKTISPEEGEDTTEEEDTDERYLLLFEFDIDDFKAINDDPDRGHGVGDEILTEIVQNIKRSLRPGDAVGRRGGDEFSALVNDVNEKDIDKVRLKILNSIGIISDRAGGTISVTGAVRKIKHGEKTTYKQASEDADVAGAIAKVLDSGNLVEFPLNVKIDSTDEAEKLQFAEAIVTRRAKREKNRYRQQMEKEQDGERLKALQNMIKLVGKRNKTDVELELEKMKARYGIYEDILK